MSDAACKAAICDDQAQGLMNTACNKIDSIKNASTQLRIEHSEIYIEYLEKARINADALIANSGE